MRDWFSFKRIVGKADVAPISPPITYNIYDSRGTEVLETIGPSAVHPLLRPDALRRANDAKSLGRGQFGHVYRATSPETGRDVAIKVMPDDGCPSHEKSRLALEAQVMRSLSGEEGFAELLYDGRQTVFGKPSDVVVMSMLGKPVEKVVCRMSQTERPREEEETSAQAFTRVVASEASLEPVPAARAELVLQIGRDLIRCLRRLHAEDYVHNDMKPANILFGAKGSGREDRAHLLDFGMVTATGCAIDEDGVFIEPNCELNAGGGTPLFASVAQLQGRPTMPVDDVESLWYCLAFLAKGALPWQWEPLERVQNIKERLFADECAIASDECDAELTADDCCSTAHCLATYETWDTNIPDALHELWAEVLAAQDGKPLDYDACLLALGEDTRTQPLGEGPVARRDRL